jgi:hypothetical protein
MELKTITIAWANPGQTIIHLTFRRGWTWDDLYAAIQHADDLITSVSHTVDLVIDIRDAGGLPGDFMRVAGDVFAGGDARANEGQKVVVGANALIQMAYQGFLKVYGHKLRDRPFRFAPSLEAAYALLDGI